MRELRSGARRSRRIEDHQPNPQLLQNILLPPPPPQTATTRRRGGRGRGNAALAKGRGIRLTDLEAEPCEIRPAAGVLGATEPALNRDKDLLLKAAVRRK